MLSGDSLMVQEVESSCNAGDAVSMLGLGRPPVGRNGNPFQFLPGKFHGQRSLVGYSQGVTKSQTGLSTLAGTHASLMKRRP